MAKTTFHRDGTVTYWSVYHQIWEQRVHPCDIPDREVAAMGERDHDRVCRLYDAVRYTIETDGYPMFANVPHCTPEIGCFGPGGKPYGLTEKEARRELKRLQTTGDWPDGRPNYWVERE